MPESGRHNQAHSFAPRRLNVLLMHSVAVEEAVWDSPGDGSACDPQGSGENRCRGQPIHIVVAENHDAFSVLNCLCQAGDGTFEFGQMGGIQNVLPTGIKKASS